MIFKTTVKVDKPCTECIVVLKQTFHPGWKVTLNGKPAATRIVFPFYPAVAIEKPGTYDVVFSYTPSPVKTVLLVTALILVTAFVTIRTLSRGA